MAYDQQILHLMTHIGEKGIRTILIAKHLYNINSTLFYKPDLEEIRRYVGNFMLKNSQSPNDLFIRMDKKGYYRLNPKTTLLQQLMIDFSSSSRCDDECEEEDEQPKPSCYQDNSPGLFD